jgi:hypothetical protein
MLAATLVHLDRFFLGTVNFYVWLVIYVALPVLLPLIWWLNRDQDPGPQPCETLEPRRLALAGGVVGVVLALASLLLIFAPSVAASFWPWQLTPLMSRIIGGWVLFAGVGLAFLFFERRYIVYRYFLPCSGIWMAILFFSSFLHLDNFNFSRAGSWLWFVLVGVLALAAFGFYFYMESLHRRSAAQPHAIAPEASV